MLSTVIVDAYNSEEASDIAEALEDLCSPDDQYGWSSAGIYSFWNILNREILYIGLAIDLPQRFRQHNGLLHAESNTCKVQQIKEFFNTYEKLGFSILVQSTLSQPLCRRALEQYGIDSERVLFESKGLLDQGLNEIKLIEGLLLESFRVQKGRFPKWNSMGGSVAGQRIQYPSPEVLLAYLTLSNTGPLLARATLREISNNETYEVFDQFLHSVRLRMFRLTGVDFKTAFEDVDNRANIRERILEAGYLKKTPEIN